MPLPWVAADVPAPAEWNAGFGTGASFGFSPATKADGSASADPHLPQPLRYKDYAADAEAADDASMLNLYRTTLELRALLLTATADTSDCAAIDAGHDVIAYSRPGTDGRRFASYTNFGVAAVTLPAGEVVLASGDLTADGALPPDTTGWILLA